ncbi:hypothetical protein WJX72_007841 [[Myrmecia] bisecta]|uniref:BRCT domain-containing protein n=1 Tax=[Myrmecia] bisecta TaxID=41462 RepID=A0AAW1PW91_9CHLO
MITITGTGFTGDARVYIRRLVSELGMKYSGDLVQGLTSHLVAADGGSPATMLAACFLDSAGIDTPGPSPAANEHQQSDNITFRRRRLRPVLSPHSAAASPPKSPAASLVCHSTLGSSSDDSDPEAHQHEVATNFSTSTGRTSAAASQATASNASRGTRRYSADAVIKVAKPLAAAPTQSTAGAYHGYRRSDLRYYEELEVTEGVWGATFAFSMRDPSLGALVYYKDLETDDAYAHELAYTRLLHVYQMPTGQVWVEHLYLFDTADLQALPKGRRYLERNSLSEGELVCGTRVFHSPATVVEEEFWLHASRSAWLRAKAADGGAESKHYFCRKAWDMDTGKAGPLPCALAKCRRAL